jgi:hypothetical protein
MIMRILGTMAIVALVGSSSLAAASADYYLKITGVGRDSAAGPIYLQATAGDLDGDGLDDEAVIRVVCADGALRTAEYTVSSPRDAATGQASGKRTHKPVTFVKEWAPGTPLLMAMKPTYDVKKLEGARKTMSEDSWTHMTLANADGLCAAAEAAVQKVTKSRSNIQNN